MCWFSPSSLCEDPSCPPSLRPFPCGDEQCIEDFNACRNGRHHLLTQSIRAQGNLSHNCWVAMVCLTKITNQTDNISCKYLFASSDLVAYIQSSDSLTQFPTIPVLFGHVRLLYDTKDIRNPNLKLVVPPDYVCYDEQLCGFLIPTFRNGSHNCRYGREMGFERNKKYDSWASIIRSIQPYFRGCSTRYKNENNSRHTSLYCCKNSSKCISKHRLVDNISDCYMNDDEKQFELSCSLNDSYRCRCHNEFRCRSPFFSRDMCSASNQTNLDDILFHEICDRFVHLLPEMIDNHNPTDETECKHRACSNIYTQCNSVWNCFDGKDEENCTGSIFKPPSLPCVAPHTYKLIYLSADKVSDGIIDCLGASDELDLCREPNLHPQSSSLFRCWNSTTCVTLFELCDGYRDCQFDDDEVFCSDRRYICNKNRLTNQNSIDDVLCRIGQMKKIYFSLQTSPIYPSSENRIMELIDEASGDFNINWNDIEYSIEPAYDDPTWAWRCNSGFYAHFSIAESKNSYKCFCPPSYYGSLCQYQNQRVFLKLGRALVDRRSVYAMVITLIDDDADRQEVNSYEQFLTVAAQYYGEFFEIYLLYSTRPKDDSKNYSARVDAFDKAFLTYVASWYFSVPFHFLPVNYIAAILSVPSHQLPNPNNCA